MYNIEYDPGSKILKIHQSGFWTEETMNMFIEALRAQMASLARAKRSFVVLSDCRDYPVQSAEIVEIWSRILGPAPIVTVPYAVVAGSVMNKLQAERALTAPNVGVFIDIGAALEWLAQRQITDATK